MSARSVWIGSGVRVMRAPSRQALKRGPAARCTLQCHAPPALSGVDLTDVYGAERKFSPDNDAVSLPNTCCLHFEFRYLCSVGWVDRVYALGLHGRWLAVGTRASNRTLPTPLTPSSTCHSASSGRHRGNRPAPGSPRSNLQLRPLLLRLSIDAWVPPLELFAH